ncbi:GPI transamidase component [Elasticomyces elasticus]|nr:GPI transamidase component [Elasticomyces elasticus]KAK3656124.1 GPI transamidase component [Elasticomyces elasticus]KAK4922321.1 GPI transamidase component [Elasticomyces elasticus]KAK5763775.1 GPI transamidase component [Elasticomyces elasticus]
MRVMKEKEIKQTREEQTNQPALINGHAHGPRVSVLASACAFTCQREHVKELQSRILSLASAFSGHVPVASCGADASDAIFVLPLGEPCGHRVVVVWLVLLAAWRNAEAHYHDRSVGSLGRNFRPSTLKQATTSAGQNPSTAAGNTGMDEANGNKAAVADIQSSAAGTAKPEPPSESQSLLRTRRWIVLSFWAIVVCFGLPHWLWTTSTYRASLPLEQMNNWAEGKACQLYFPFNIRLGVQGWSQGEVDQLAEQVRPLLDGTDKQSPFAFLIDTHESDCGYAQADEAVAVSLAVNDGRNAHEHISSLESWSSTLSLRYGLARPKGRDGLARWVADEVREVFQPQIESLIHLLSGTPFALERTALTTAATQAKLDARNTRAFKYASTYHLTFSLFVSGSSPAAWEIEEALHDYLEPLIDALKAISNITVDTQVQLHASFSPSIACPVYDKSSKEWKLRKEDLSGFINAAEWPLSPSIGSGPTINFVLYAPTPTQSPLVIAETGGSSWLVPQWGGVAILNSQTHTTRLSKADLEPTMLTFADQLTSLIGLPAEPAQSLALRLKALSRERATSLILSSSSTLGALSRLTLKLTSIAIPDTVAASVQTSLDHLTLACSDLKAGRYESALTHARTADEASEKAFFEPSMVGQVYFPDEHKVAVYVPLLGPMAVPLVMIGLKELVKFRDARRKVKTG